MAARPRCQHCGHFVPIGRGTTGSVTRANGVKNYFCGKCLKMGAELKDGSVGTLADYLREQDYIKEFKLV